MGGSWCSSFWKGCDSGSTNQVCDQTHSSKLGSVLIKTRFEPLTRVPKTSQVRFDMCSKSNLVRMGPEPWIIIRFFYRSQGKHSSKSVSSFSHRLTSIRSP